MLEQTSEGGNRMEYQHMELVAKKVASILAENEATVNDLPEIFNRARSKLVVTIQPEGPKQGYLHSTYVLPAKFTEDGSREGD